MSRYTRDPRRLDAIELIVATWVGLDATQDMSEEERDASLLRLAEAFKHLGVTPSEMREVSNRPT